MSIALERASAEVLLVSVALHKSSRYAAREDTWVSGLETRVSVWGGLAGCWGGAGGAD